jgi:putative hydrolase of the HAD superfamily
MAIKAVIIDCFGVLVMPGRIMLQQAYPDKASQIDDLCRQSDYGMITREQFNKQAAELVNLTPEETQIQYYNTEVHNQPLIEWLLELKKSGKYKTGLISNVGHNWLDKLLIDIKQTDLFDEIILSSDVSVVKPDHRIFEMMVDRLGLLESECVMIDDMLANIDGAERAGMQGILFGTNRQLQDDFNKLVEAEKNA